MTPGARPGGQNEGQTIQPGERDRRGTGEFIVGSAHQKGIRGRQMLLIATHAFLVTEKDRKVHRPAVEQCVELSALPFAHA